MQKKLTYCALCVTLALLLSYVKLFQMPQGGTVSPCSTLFIALAGFWFGPVAGITTGAAFGLLQLIIDPFVIHPAQMLLDYPLAFGFLGISGFFRNKSQGLIVGYLAGMTGRLVCSFLSGVIFFASYAPVGWNPFDYSAVYNGSYQLAEAVLSVALVSIPAFKLAVNRVGDQAVKV